MTSPDILNREQGENGWDKLAQHCPGLLSLHLSPLIPQANKDVHRCQVPVSKDWSMKSWLLNHIPALVPHTCSVIGITHPSDRNFNVLDSGKWPFSLIFS